MGAVMQSPVSRLSIPGQPDRQAPVSASYCSSVKGTTDSLPCRTRGESENSAKEGTISLGIFAVHDDVRSEDHGIAILSLTIVFCLIVLISWLAATRQCEA